MGTKKTPGRKPAAAAAPAKPSNLSSTLSASKLSAASSVQRASFAPESLHLSLFASLIDGVDSQRLRVHDISNGRLKCEYAIERGLKCASLTWSSLDAAGKRKKKRKRLSEAEAAKEAENAVIAMATSAGSVLLFSPAEASLVGKLDGGHVGPVKDFKFGPDGKAGTGWSCGADGKLVEWDWKTQSVLRTISLPDAQCQVLAPISNYILAASHSVAAYDTSSQDTSPIYTFSASATPIHSLLTSSDGIFFCASESDRYINVYSLPQQRQLGSLVAESDVKKISLSLGPDGKVSEDSVVVAVTADGIVEIFKIPFAAQQSKGDEGSSRKKALTAKAVARVKVVRPKTSAVVHVVDASIHNGELVVAWPEGGASMTFEHIKCFNADDRQLTLLGEHTITKSATVSIGADLGINGTAEVEKTSLNQAGAVVVAGDAANDVTANGISDEESSEADDDEEDSEAESGAEAEPSFGEKFQALNVSEGPITRNALTAPSSSKNKAIQAPAAGTLTTVLSQALCTNDQTLLESCFQVTDSKQILATIRRLESPQAVTLLERLAERIARKPGRAGSLGTWVRWTIVAHGGYLVSLPDLLKTLSALHTTLNTRASALPRLLALQGRLDMLNAQLELRNTIRGTDQAGDLAESRTKANEQEVTYIEGQDQESSDEEPEEVGMEGLQIEDASNFRSRVVNSDEESGEEEESGDEEMVNGIDSEELGSEDDDDDDEDDDEEDEDSDNSLLDLEAEEASEDEESVMDDEDEMDYSDEDGEELGFEDSDTDSEDEEVVPKAKAGGKKR